jgi:hypothetical protein
VLRSEKNIAIPCHRQLVGINAEPPLYCRHPLLFQKPLERLTLRHRGRVVQRALGWGTASGGAPGGAGQSALVAWNPNPPSLSCTR